MKLANVHGRAVLVTGEGAGIDVELASGSRFGPALSDIYDNWDDFRRWVNPDLEVPATASVTFETTDLSSPSPTPQQIFAMPLNYRDHAAEGGVEASDDLPAPFTKFVSSLAGADTVVQLPEGGTTDWEVELVVIIGRSAYRIGKDEGWDHVAGLAVGQDISERTLQRRGPAPQFGLAKSYPGFSPVGPWLVTTDELANPDDLAIGCSIDGETMQDGRTNEMIFSVPALVHGLSQIVRLYPGDLIFTGTTAGVGGARKPPRFLKAGEELVSWVEGIGEIRQRFVD